MEASQSEAVIDAVKSTAIENPNFIFYARDVSSFGTEMLNDLEGAGLSVNRLDLTKVDFHAFISPTQSTIDSEVLVFENVQTADYICAGMLVALIMTRLTGNDMWRGKTVVIIASEGRWRDPELKSLLEDLIEAGTMPDEE